MLISPACDSASLESSAAFVKWFGVKVSQGHNFVYLGFSRPCLISVGEEDCGGGLGDVGKIMIADELLRNSTEVVDVGRVDVEGGGVSNVVETTVSKEKKRRKGNVDVWRCEFGGSWGLVGILPRPWVVGASGC